MLELLDILCRRIYPLLQTVVGELIQDNEIVLSDESLDHPIACHPASGVDQDVSIPVLLELLLQLLVQSVCAHGGRSSSRAQPELLRSLDGSLLREGVLS